MKTSSLSSFASSLNRLLICGLSVATLCTSPVVFGETIPQILPPAAKTPLTAEQIAELEKELEVAQEAFETIKDHSRAADVDIFLKAVRYAIEFGEWYDKTPEDGLKKVRRLLNEAKERISALKRNETPWLTKSGRTVLGFYSHLDDSPQPYGVEIPDGLSWGAGEKKVPIWVWLHGRGDTATDLHFINSQLNNKPGEFKTTKAIIIHPFGRYCNGFKSAGEIDVLEATKDALQRFNGDANRIALMGFSMGGAGAWHMGAHYADQWALVHAGAGFVDVKRYQNLTPDKMPSQIEQTLWGVYDVPNYTRNFFNLPGLIAYSGEQDKQRDSAEYMNEELAREGYQLKHLIGPGMGHKYHPEVREQVREYIEEVVAKGRNSAPYKVTLQSRSARYSRMHWVHVMEVLKPWEEIRVDAELDDYSGELRLKASNVRTLAVLPPWKDFPQPRRIVINDQLLEFTDETVFAGEPQGWYYLHQDNGQWTLQADDPAPQNARKAGGTCIEDAFLSRFVIVLPDRPGRSPKTDAWVKAESEYFIQRWRKLMRGDPIVAKASDVGADLATNENLILWGDDISNPCIAQRLKKLPVAWDNDSVILAGSKASADSHVPLLVFPEYPNQRSGPLVVLNSGLTFRESHDRTNSLQNPKLPDWALLDVTTPRDDKQAGAVKAAGFFDSRWNAE